MRATSTSASSKTHLVVGDGITAFAFVEAVAPHLQSGDHLMVLGRNADALGRGPAYAKGEPGTPWRYAYLLNSPADDIDPDFAIWLEQRWDVIAATMEGRSPDWSSVAAPLVARGDVYGVNAPREFYGDYMQERVDALLQDLRTRGVTVAQITDTAVTLDLRDDACVQVQTKDGRTLVVDTVDVAPGGPTTMRIAGDEGPYAVPSVFGHEHEIAKHIQAGAEIFCIGGNAAMLDVLRLCQSLVPEEKIKMAACAPDGEVPAALIPRLPRHMTVPQLSKGHQTANSFLDEVRREIDAAVARGDEMREIRAGFRAHFLAHPIHTYLTDIEAARHVPAALRFWLRGGTRDTILDMHRLMAEGHTRMVQGFVQNVTHGPDGPIVHVIDADGVEQAIPTGFVVNCAGAGPGSEYDPLTTDMIAKGLISICPTTKGLRVGAKCQTAQPRVRYLSPAVTEIGSEVMGMPLYDAHMLRTHVARAS